MEKMLKIFIVVIVLLGCDSLTKYVYATTLPPTNKLPNQKYLYDDLAKTTWYQLVKMEDGTFLVSEEALGRKFYFGPDKVTFFRKQQRNGQISYSSYTSEIDSVSRYLDKETKTNESFTTIFLKHYKESLTLTPIDTVRRIYHLQLNNTDFYIVDINNAELLTVFDPLTASSSFIVSNKIPKTFLNKQWASIENFDNRYWYSRLANSHGDRKPFIYFGEHNIFIYLSSFQPITWEPSRIDSIAENSWLMDCSNSKGKKTMQVNLISREPLIMDIVCDSVEYNTNETHRFLNIRQAAAPTWWIGYNYDSAVEGVEMMREIYEEDKVALIQIIDFNYNKPLNEDALSVEHKPYVQYKFKKKGYHVPEPYKTDYNKDGLSDYIYLMHKIDTLPPQTLRKVDEKDLARLAKKKIKKYVVEILKGQKEGRYRVDVEKEYFVDTFVDMSIDYPENGKLILTFVNNKTKESVLFNIKYDNDSDDWYLISKEQIKDGKETCVLNKNTIASLKNWHPSEPFQIEGVDFTPRDDMSHLDCGCGH